MSSFIEELLEIAKKIIPEADKTSINYKTNEIKLSCKAERDPLRRHKRLQPIIIQIDIDCLPLRQIPDHVGDKMRVEFASFISNKRAQFNPRTTKHRDESHTPEIWIFPPED